MVDKYKKEEGKMKELSIKNNVIPFNLARQKAYNSSYRTLKQLYGKNNITEKDFQNKWYENLVKFKRMTNLLMNAFNLLVNFCNLV